MSVSGNRPASVSPPPRTQSNTQWQTTTAPPTQPLSPSLANSRQQHVTNTAAANGDNDISLRQILDRYKDDPDLLKHILKAKVEEDKKQTTVDTIKVEQARIHLRELDIELLREQNKITSGYYDKHPQQQLPALSSTSLHPPTTVPAGITNSSSSSNSSGYTLAVPCTEPTSNTPYCGLAPVQQQVLARITGESATTSNSNRYSHNNHHAGNNHHPYQHPVVENGHATESTLPPPRSPVAYPHSAHPLCPPSEPLPYRNSSSSTTWSYRHRFYPRNNAHQPNTPISPGIGDSRDQPPSLPPPQQQHQQQDIQKKRARSSTHNDGGENGNITHDQVMEALKAKIQRGNNDRSKRARIPSPRSSKPILPPIDTSVGRIPSSSSSSIPSVTATAPLPSTTSPTITNTAIDQESKQQSTRPTTSDTSSSSTVATESTSTKS